MELTIFPNPGNSLNVKISKPINNGFLELTNINGLVLQKIPTEPHLNTYLLEVANLKPGLYFVNAGSNNSIISTKKWIKL